MGMDIVAPRLVPLFNMVLRIGESVEIGQTTQGQRRVARVTGGTFDGDRMRGDVLAGEDWITRRADGVFVLDVRLPLFTADGSHILMRYGGFRHGPEDVMARLARGEEVSPADYYFRIAPSFEVADGAYGWLGRLLAVGSGRRQRDTVTYQIWEVL
jgi:hypothetical protein